MGYQIRDVNSSDLGCKAGVGVWNVKIQVVEFGV
jgi:hypothetical protein